MFVVFFFNISPLILLSYWVKWKLYDLVKVPIRKLAKNEYWRIDWVTQCSYINKKLSSCSPSPPMRILLSHLPRSTQQKERGYREWRYGTDLWDLGNGNGKARLVYLFPMEMKILVSGQRRAVSISLKWFNSTFKLSCGNWYYLTFSRQSVYIFAFISQLKANWNCPVQIEIKIHFAYRLGKKATGRQKQALFYEAI